MKCFYHKGDFDGICSGAIVLMKYPDCEMYGMEYGDEFPWDIFSRLDDKEVVYMCDYSLNPFEDMFSLSGMCNLKWIDHHKTAFDSYVKCTRNGYEGFASHVDLSMAACELTWLYLYGEDKEMPYAVRMFGRYDIWAHDFSPYVLPFQYGARTFITEGVYDLHWKALLIDQDPSIEADIITKGTAIIKYEKQQNKLLMDTISCELEFDGYKALAINSNQASSTVFESRWNDAIYDIMLSYYRTPSKKWKVSLRSVGDKVNVGELAKKYGGGGGHKNASGFVCDKLPFEI